MAFKDLREWINALEAQGMLRRIKAEVNWDVELGAITRKVLSKEGPALLFENIKDYGTTPCKKVFTNGLGSRENRFGPGCFPGCFLSGPYTDRA